MTGSRKQMPRGGHGASREENQGMAQVKSFPGAAKRVLIV